MVSHDKRGSADFRQHELTLLRIAHSSCSVRPSVNSLCSSPTIEICLTLRHCPFQYRPLSHVVKYPLLLQSLLHLFFHLLKVLLSSSHELITELCLHKDRISTVSCHILALAVTCISLEIM